MRVQVQEFWFVVDWPKWLVNKRQQFLQHMERLKEFSWRIVPNNLERLVLPLDAGKS